MKKLSSIAALFLLVLSPACSSPGSGSGAAGSGSGAPTGAATNTAEAEDNAPEEPGVKLVDKGAAPYRKLRYQVADGAVETLVLVQSRSDALVGQKPRSVPGSRLTLALTARGKNAAGDREWSYEVKDAAAEKDAKAAAGLAAQVQEALKKTIGLKGTFTASSRGNLRKVEPVIPAGADPTPTQLAQGLADSLHLGFVALPAGPVGAGARWEHGYEARQAGINVKMVSRYEVLSISGDEVKVKLTQSQEAGKQTIDAGPGQKIEIRDYKSEGTGEITLSLKRLSPRESKNESKGSMTLEGLGKAAKEIKITTLVQISGS